MGLYTQFIFPRICDLLLGRPFIAKHRSIVLSQAGGDVLEIGFGTGLNLPHYPDHVRRITTVDPSAGMHRLARKRIEGNRVAVDQRLLGGELLPFERDSFDCVVSTFTLCTIEDVSRALGEVYRVLRPGGRLLFLEHGLSPDPGVQRWQRRLNRLEMWLANGCRLNRNIRELVGAQPFVTVAQEEFYMPRIPKTHGYMYQGVATK